ncbi:hypothetical protein DE146DRAFT_756774 [Phaeosphaeria sp. MPI-PUGE-AT-0046c]|nr:hypothetical protein DE146DRAFT_756774 [Phaeosphaeria sp. MPI-PUGE-AT-0046c]
MGRITGTVHHCPGRDGWVSDVSPGGCVKARVGSIAYCKKHQTPCINGCPDGIHLKNQSGCLSCEQRVYSEQRRAKKQADKERAKAQKDKDDDFWNPPKERKR